MQYVSYVDCGYADVQVIHEHSVCNICCVPLNCVCAREKQFKYACRHSSACHIRFCAPSNISVLAKPFYARFSLAKAIIQLAPGNIVEWG